MLISNVSLEGLIVIFSVFWNCNFSTAIIASVCAATAAESHKCDQTWRWAHPAFGFSHRQKSSTERDILEWPECGLEHGGSRCPVALI